MGVTSYFAGMKVIPWISVFVLWVLTCNVTRLHGQTWKYSFGWSVNYTYGKIDGQKVLYPNAYSMLKAEAGLSAKWPLSPNTTGYSTLSNVLRLGVFTLGVERRLNNRWTVISGVEFGGRLVNYTEYAQDGRGEGDSEEDLANIARRSFVVCSVPLLMKYKLYANKVDYSLMGGVFLNEAFSKGEVTPFYTTRQSMLFYPSLSVGFRICSVKSKGFALDCSYQYGLSEAISDQITVLSSAAANQPVKYVSATSNGSHFRLGVSYVFSVDHSKQKRRSATHSFIPFAERSVGKVVRIKTVSDTFQVCFEDNKTADADSIRIVLNQSDEPVMLELQDTAQCIDFDVHSRLTNTIDIYAINEGRIKPNTMLLRYVDHKNRRKVLLLNNGMEKYIRLKVIYLK